MTRMIFKAIEYRLVIPGKAVSFRSPERKKYQRIVRHIAKSVFRHPGKETYQIRIDYFHLQRRKMDMDNIAKCIMDALNGIAYIDDRQVKLQQSTGHDLSRPLRIYGGPVDIVKPIVKYDQYIIVRLREVIKS